MRVAFIDNHRVRDYYIQLSEDHGERFCDLSEDTPAKCMKSLICDALRAAKKSEPASLIVNGEIKPCTRENILKVLSGLSTGYLIMMRYYYVAEGNWRSIEHDREWNIHDVINDLLMEREGKTSVEEVNELNKVRGNYELEVEKKLKESKTFQKFLKSMEHDAENSRKVRKILEIMSTF